MARNIQALAFFFRTDTQTTGKDAYNFQDDKGCNRCIYGCRRDTGELHAKLLPHAVDTVREALATKQTQFRRCKNTSEKGPQYSSDTVYRKYIQGIIYLPHSLDQLCGIETYDARTYTDHQRTGRANKTGRRGDGTQTGNLIHS